MITEGLFSNNLSLVKRQIKYACDISGRSSDEVTLLPVTKNWPVGVVSYCMAHGIRKLGKTGFRKLLRRWIEEGMEFELIGHLQSNKAKLAVGTFNRIQSR